MTYKLINYTAKPERADENERLIGVVFRELHASKPTDIGYLVLRLEDGTFVHLFASEREGATLTSLASFQAFQDEIDDRQIGPPQFRGATVVGNYGLLETATRMEAR